ncbi:MAG: PleD family two-component system response regulator [Acidimicrobiales bacterium]
MRLDFNVLWVDDQPNAVKAQITRIRAQMANEGFNFNPTLCTSIAEVEAHIAGDVFRDEVDLILVDWDLGGGIHGQDVIERIRQVAQYKDVVFYSARTLAADLRRMAFERGLECIYCASRDGLVDEVLGVFESLVKKVLDLDHTRGIVMGATSDIDHMIHSCLVQIEAKLDDDGKRELVSQAIKRVQERVKDIGRQGAKLETATSVTTILEAHMIFGATDRLRMLRRLLEGDANHAQAVEKIKYYMDNVVPERNVLGHMALAPEGKPHAVVTSEGKLINLDDMRTLRKLILGLREDFRALTDALKA